jgi:hypothetical protein
LWRCSLLQYPKSLSDLVDKLWITSKSKDGPEEDENLTTSPVDIMSDTEARLHSNGGVGFGESRKGTAGDSVSLLLSSWISSA